MTLGDEMIEGVVLHVRTVSRDYWGTCAIQVGDDEAADPATVTGGMLGIEPGLQIRARGHWTTHARFGRQFKAQSIEICDDPSTEWGAVLWLTSALPGVGEKTARALIEEFGLPGLWSTLDGDGSPLTAVKGITAKKAAAIAEAYRDQRATRATIQRLRGFGLTDLQARRVVEKFGDEALRRLQTDPYSLTRVDGIGFVIADRIALRMGADPVGDARARAGVEFVADEVVRSGGHVYLPLPKLSAAAARKLEIPEDRIAHVIRMLESEGRAVIRGARFYPRALYECEARAAALILEARKAAKI